MSRFVSEHRRLRQATSFARSLRLESIRPIRFQGWHWNADWTVWYAHWQRCIVYWDSSSLDQPKLTKLDTETMISLKIKIDPQLFRFSTSPFCVPRFSLESFQWKRSKYRKIGDQKLVVTVLTDESAPMAWNGREIKCRNDFGCWRESKISKLKIWIKILNFLQSSCESRS